MRPIFIALFFGLALMQPNAQRKEASGAITALQFVALAGTALTPNRKETKP
jgi:hypothetical protein